MSTLDTEATPDINYLSFSDGVWSLYAGSNYQETFLEADHPIPTDLVPIDPKTYDSILKCSGRTNTVLANLRVAQGKENTLDINNKSAGLVFDGEWGVAGREGQQVFTIKGGSHDIRLDGVVHSNGARADVVIGLWSDQSFASSYNLNLGGLRHYSGRPLTVILCRVRNPIRAALGRPTDIVLPPGAKVLFWKSLGAQVGWWVKWAAVKLGVLS